MGVQVLIADDHQILREGLRGLLERAGFQVVAEAADGREAVRLAASKLCPDVAVLDLAMPNLNGVDAAREMLRTSPRLKTILLTMHTEEPYVLEALRAGVSGYVLKTQATDDLVQAIREVMRGSLYLSPRVSRTLADAYRSKSELPSSPLSPRERQVLQLVAEGNTTKQVAAILGVSLKTADAHRTHLMAKLDIHETASLVRYAIRMGLVQP
ncbi:MAG TPA: response regulator transcription factor [Candidatus Krumholzibacteria bacterium]|jgi:DNA-binding NarL/FixJ family response regulator|nr:response regulator transcription factor [Candidatus Krumholzibacteria bacterium]